MTTTRIYQPIPLKISEEINLDGRASHHLATVLRAERGECITLFNGEGGEYHAKIIHIEKKIVRVTILEHKAIERESVLSLHLIQGVAKTDKMDLIMQKAVELGVTRVTPVYTHYTQGKCEKSRDEKRWLHWHGIMVASAEQCGRNRLPLLDKPMSLSASLSKNTTDLAFVLSPYAHHRLTHYSLKKAHAIKLLVGPEGGLSAKEIATCEEMGMQSLYCGPRILRTETAALALLAILQSHFGDM